MGLEKVSGQVGNFKISFETGHIAKQAHGAVMAQCGETVVMATVVSSYEVDEKSDFFPLTVDYREKSYAAGKIPGGFFKREGRPSEKETLTARLIDRPIRSVFGKSYTNETQILLNVVSFDGENDGDIVAMNGASAALAVSDIPYTEILGAVRVGLVDGEFVINPTFEQLEESDLDLVVAGTKQKIVMIEAGAREVTEDIMMDALHFGHEGIKKIVALIEQLKAKAGKPTRALTTPVIDETVYNKVKEIANDKAFNEVFAVGGKKEDIESKTAALKEKVMAAFNPESEGYCADGITAAFKKCEKNFVRELILSQNRRPDGRSFREIRDIACEVAVLPRTHGSALFTRGETQSLTVCTLGTGDDEQRIDALEGQLHKRFMLHYNFPPSSVGEIGRVGGTGRREIGHGALAERAIKAIIPNEEDFPYVVRVVSDITESNGSSSMATVCAATLSLMDAGVPIKAPVSGIAMGLVTDDGGRWKVLTDIAGIEDFLGDMDFKAGGTREGLTTLQMDLKISGVTDEILLEAFDAAKQARLEILDKIEAAIAKPRKELSKYAPRLETIKINPEKIGALIGPGGKNIRAICEETGAKVEINDEGYVIIASADGEAMEAAKERVLMITAEAEIGKVYHGKVVKLMNFGAFCEFLPGQEGLCHVSELSDEYVKDVTEFVRAGDDITIKVIGIEGGKVNLSAKQAVPGGVPKLPEGAERDTIQTPPARSGGRDRGGDRGRRR